MVRLFVALPIDDGTRDELAGLAGGIPGARWVPPENYHLTLRFIGEVENVLADELDEALATIRAKPFELKLRGVNVFEKAGRIHSLYAGVERCERLSHLQSKVETALQRAGLPPERKKFAPHVTLARTEKAAPDKLIAFVQAHNLFRAPPQPVNHFSLYSSRLGKEQAHYVAEVDYALEGASLAARAAEH
ncbi:RNA 2',3'-cyclic phosphodiesterase [Roseomonas marmotae]|uniref:RNA 2',3'-cyclic phosphodiesterase n=1 Tax=Roseomonas marmotae TaxID=2768161 RepID=A0ABS3KFT0_9PROT|nr:RNA 2',3'-cyclic phosphodiesterase [Roseomonas marmotae]MBO1076327.1 RNA 2',3'-cyclic phosphodiesterase [Roseomonas marmotae]QTI80562.1 RNA 2',3'-cyclic phosphodiesterase [Roseomonas marmotae]